MKVLLTSADGDRYSIKEYKLKVLQSTLPDLKPVPQGVQKAHFREFGAEPSPKAKATDAKDNESEKSSSEDEGMISKEAHQQIVDSLLQKADEFSDKYLKSQMQYEELLESRDKGDEAVRKQAYDEGFEAGVQEHKHESEAVQNSMISQMQEAIKSLTQESESFSTALHSIQEELIGAALDIAKEVIIKELSKDSYNITLALAQKLMEDIDKESQIRLKVNPQTLDTLAIAMSSSKNIKVEADSAVQVGGVIIISKLGTIEADIMSRYEQIKRSALNP